MTEDTREPVLVTERLGHVVVLRLNRPEARNAMSPELSAALGRALLAAENDHEIRCVVLTGTGDRAFCAGMDLRAFAAGQTTPGPPDENRQAVARLVDGKLAKPVIGAANATAVAGGFEMLMGCDLVVASSAARFGLPEAKRGLFAARGGMFLSSRIPVAIVLELALTGDPIDAQRAYELGLVNRVVPPAQVMPMALDLAEKIARNAPLAIAASRDLVKLAMTDTEAARTRQTEWRERVFNSVDAKEGAQAFVEKRDPVWKGR
ncbi:enoyl-CoA hydratase-related protein [Phenylobacterium sp. VNQ135]|uniref:enoyl-CoA hydratase-related protein n=1 Tax=Phenylobacterium sp. VNQ135 TaxID=3400922 RepID=UPI003BFABF09